MVEVRLAGPASQGERLRNLPGVRSLGDGVVRLHVEGSVDALVKELARLPVETLTSETGESTSSSSPTTGARMPTEVRVEGLRERRRSLLWWTVGSSGWSRSTRLKASDVDDAPAEAPPLRGREGGPNQETRKPAGQARRRSTPPGWAPSPPSSPPPRRATAGPADREGKREVGRCRAVAGEQLTRGVTLT
ncbi:MAG: hypothetical protein ICV69_15645 [Thermoleophilaceae bacterium]|nr:hypothetical protein [Thermoleophilaceae bacterium]